MRPDQGQKRQQGTTLIEVLVASAICGTVVFALAGLVSISIQQSKDRGTTVSMAASLAGQRMDRLLALPFTTATTDSGLTANSSTCTDLNTTTGCNVDYLDPSGTVIAGATSTTAGVFFTRTWRITDTTATLKLLEVRVNARSVSRSSAAAGSAPSATLACYLARQ